MWNEKTKQFVADQKLVVLGVVQEQHAERALLYKQWKQYDFPIAQDSFNELGLAAVPIPILIDESGNVLEAKPSLENIDSLVATKVTAPKAEAPKLAPEHREFSWLKSNDKAALTVNWFAIADQHLRIGSPESLRKAIGIYESIDKPSLDKASLGCLYFRLGVACRMLYDKSPASAKDVNDFNRAAGYWSKALEQNPNQYIWRRRIQQYGPRQSKPYPFYDWVEKAKQEIIARGEAPVQTVVPLTESEIAKPSRRFSTSNEATNPDPQSKIDTDDESLVKVNTTVVPSSVKRGDTVRVHLQFECNDSSKWNNEAGEMLVWINGTKAEKTSKSLLKYPPPTQPDSAESRSFEFEVKTEKQSVGEIQIDGYALFYICKTEDGQCLYRRKDFSIPIPVLD